MYDLWDIACKRNCFIKYGLIPCAEQSLCYQIEYKIFLYYLLCMICGTLHVTEMVSVNMASFLVQNNLCAGKLSLRTFFIIWYVSFVDTACKGNVSIKYNLVPYPHQSLCW